MLCAYFYAGLLAFVYFLRCINNTDYFAKNYSDYAIFFVFEQILFGCVEACFETLMWQLYFVY